jgi:hypothetical protein
MKPLIFLFSMIGLSTHSLCQSKTIPKPDFTNQVYYYDTASGNMMRCEKTTASTSADTKFFKVKISYEVQGVTSSVRVPQGTQITFLLDLGNANWGAPETALTMYKAETKKKIRKVLLESASAIGPTHEQDNQIRFDVKNLGNGVYQFFPSSSLEKGEYVFKPLLQDNVSASRNLITVFCITIY